jgi:hypothetical protein
MKSKFFFNLVCEAIGTAANPGLLCQPRMIMKMIMEKQLGCRLTGETEVLGANLPQRHFCRSQNPTWPDPGLNPGRRGGKPATNRLSYGAAKYKGFWIVFLPWAAVWHILNLTVLICNWSYSTLKFQKISFKIINHVVNSSNQDYSNLSILPTKAFEFQNDSTVAKVVTTRACKHFTEESTCRFKSKKQTEQMSCASKIFRSIWHLS